VRLLDRIVTCNEPFVVQSNGSGERTRLSGALDVAPAVRACPLRYVLSDDLAVLCTDLAYSKGATVYECLDLVRIPAESVWIEWSDQPWRERLLQYGFSCDDAPQRGGRRGLLLRASRNGLHGTLRAFWTVGEGDRDLLASAMEAHFYLDGQPAPPTATSHGEPRFAPRLYVDDEQAPAAAVLARCFHFEFEPSWERYYQERARSAAEYRSVQLQSAGAVAIAVPVLLAFLLLLNTRDGLPQRASALERLNRARAHSGRQPLLDHVEVRAPLCQPAPPVAHGQPGGDGRRAPRLHHVRGHLMRRANQLIWRSSHVRGSARLGTLRSRTVTWTLDYPRSASAARSSSVRSP